MFMAGYRKNVSAMIRLQNLFVVVTNRDHKVARGVGSWQNIRVLLQLLHTNAMRLEVTKVERLHTQRRYK